MNINKTSNFKERVMTIAIYILVSLLFVVLSNSLLIKDAFDLRFLEFELLISTFLKIVLVIIATGLFIVNLYSFTIFRELNNLLYTIISFLITLALTLELIITINTKVILYSVNLNYIYEQVQIVSIFILIFLSIKVFVFRKKREINLSMRSVPLFFLIIIVALFVLYQGAVFGHSIKTEVLTFVIYFLSFINLIAFIYLYLEEGDYISSAIIFSGLIFFITGIFSRDQSVYQLTLSLSFRIVTMIFVLNGFYKQLFTTHLLEVDEMNRQKDLYNSSLKSQVEERTNKLLNTTRALESEIDNAKRLQMALLPPKEIAYSHCSFVTANYACDKLSGDFLDIYNIDEDRIGMYILDVSGHGVGAALLNVFCYHYIRSTSPLIRKYLGSKPHKILLNLYEEFNRLSFPDEIHIVIFLASYDMRLGRLTYSSGGLNAAPILVRKNGDIELLDKSKGFPICKMGDFFSPTFTNVDIQLFKGDRILFYTDGLLDERLEASLSQDDLKILLLENANKTIVELRKEIDSKIERMSHKLIDDISYFIMQVD